VKTGQQNFAVDKKKPEIFSCPECSAPMELKHARLHKGKRSRYRVRHFSCPICGHAERVIADGTQEESWFNK